MATQRIRSSRRNMSPSQHLFQQPNSPTLNMIIINILVNIIHILSTRAKHLDPIDIPPRRIRQALQGTLGIRLGRIEKSHMNWLLWERDAGRIV